MKRWPVRQSFLLGLAVLLGFLYLSARTAETYAEAPGYVRIGMLDRISWWLASTRCAQQTHSFLTICGREDQLHPLEDFLIADDLGRAFILDRIALFRQGRMTRGTVIRFNVLLNFVGIGALSAIFWFSNFRKAALVILWLGTRYAMPGNSLYFDASAGYEGIHALAMVGVIWAVAICFSSAIPKSASGGHVLGAFALLLAYLMRQSLGAGAVLSCLAVIVAMAIFNWARLKERARVMIGAGLILMTTVAGPTLLIRLRDHLFHVPASTHIHAHGFAQALIGGLGSEPNSWGMSWNDNTIEALVQKANPNVVKYSPEFFRILRSSYLDAVRQKPFEAVKIYTRKFRKCLDLPISVARIPTAVWMLFFFAVIPLSWKKLSPERRLPLVMLFFLGIVNMLLIAQGVLAYPSYGYLHPLRLGIVVMLACLIEAIPCKDVRNTYIV